MNPQTIIEKILKMTGPKIGESVSELLGQKLALGDPGYRKLSKEEYFFDAEHSLVLTTFNVSGELQGKMYLTLRLKDAILLGGTLIMLPEAELEKHIKSEEYGEDESDAFGEIANIIAGVVNDIFQNKFPQKIHLNRGDSEMVVPHQVDAASEAPFPEALYFQAAYSMQMEDRQLGVMELLLPAELFGIEAGKAAEQKSVEKETTAASELEPEDTAGKKPASPAASTIGQKQKTVEPAEEEQAVAAERGEESAGPPAVLIVAQSEALAEPFAEVVREHGYTPRVIGFNDNVKEALHEVHVRGGFLVMEEVNEQGFAIVIKVKSACGKMPLMAAGPNWTRNAVLKAVRYGACDIIVTPPEPDDIREKLEAHLGPHPAQAA